MESNPKWITYSFMGITGIIGPPIGCPGGLNTLQKIELVQKQIQRYLLSNLNEIGQPNKVLQNQGYFESKIFYFFFGGSGLGSSTGTSGSGLASSSSLATPLVGVSMSVLKLSF